jgi:hypothetical protein
MPRESPANKKSGLFHSKFSSVADPDLRSDAFLTRGSGMGKKSGSGSGMNIPDHISQSLEKIFWVKVLWCGSGMKKIVFGIRDGKNSDPGPGINIPDPQHWNFPHKQKAAL